MSGKIPSNSFTFRKSIMLKCCLFRCQPRRQHSNQNKRSCFCRRQSCAARVLLRQVPKNLLFVLLEHSKIYTQKHCVTDVRCVALSTTVRTGNSSWILSISPASHFLSSYLNHPGTGTHEHHRGPEAIGWITFAPSRGWKGSARVCGACYRCRSYSYRLSWLNIHLKNIQCLLERQWQAMSRFFRGRIPAAHTCLDPTLPGSCLDQSSGSLDSRSALSTGWSLEDIPVICRVSSKLYCMSSRLNVNKLQRCYIVLMA